MNFLPVGSIIDPSRDQFATSGAHGDFRIIPMYGDQRGQHIDPATRPELLGRIFAGDGDNRRPITSYPMTSGFGPRNLDIPGASKFHKGMDYAIPMGTPLSIQGATEYYSQNGVGVAKITDSQGRPYEIELFHTEPGKFVQATAPVPAAVPAPSVASAPIADVTPRAPLPERGALYSVEAQVPSPVGDKEEPAIAVRSIRQGGQSQQGNEARALQDMQRGLNQMLSSLQRNQTEEQRTRLALDRAAKQAAEAFQGGKSVI